MFWQANAANPPGQITQETLGNGVVTNRVYDPITSWVSSIQSGMELPRFRGQFLVFVS
jgi:hypothetical protein